jgi:hypothetical protein
MSRVRSLSMALAGLLAMSGAAFTWAAFRPGFMSYDSFAQYAIARSGAYDDWYPPLMSWTWGLLLRLLPGPEGMLALQLILLWGGLMAWCWRWRGSVGAPLLLLTGAVPWVLNFAGVLWKDVLMAGALLMAAALAQPPGRIWRLVAATGLLFYALNLRYNAAFAVVPLAWLLIRTAWPRLPVPAVAAGALAATAAMLLGSGVVSYQLLGAQRAQPANYVLLDDLVHLSLLRGRSVVPDVPFAQVQACAAREIGQTKLVGKYFCLRETESGRLAAQSPALSQHWRAEVMAHPLAWLRFRLAAFAYLLRAPGEPPYYIWHPGVDENTEGVHHSPGLATVLTQRSVQVSAQAAPALFRPSTWLAFDLALLLLSLLAPQSNSRDAAQALLFSSALYLLGYLPLTPMADLRYAYWSMVAATLALLLMAIEKTVWSGRWRSDRLIPVLGMAIAVSIAVPLCTSWLALNTDQMVLRTLGPAARSLPPPNRLADLQRNSSSWRVVGRDPWLAWDVVPPQDTADVRFLAFEFHCVGGLTRPLLQLFWWGGSQAAPVEERSWISPVREGMNVVSLASLPGLSQVGQLQGLRFDLFDPAACTSISLPSLAIYH